MKSHFVMFAAYNRWANELIYEAGHSLAAEDWGKDVGAFFKSFGGTLNHLLVTDRIWLARFKGERPEHTRLDDIISMDRATLSAARIAEDERIAAFVEESSESDLNASFSYASGGREISQRLFPVLSHLFNHQTHHRGQAHGILAQLGREPPSLDLIRFIRANPQFQ